MKKVSVIISGSCNPTVKKGAYGCIVLTDEKDLPLDACYTNTTANRLELMAVIRALKELGQIFPGEELNIELVSKLNYLTHSFRPGQLRANLLGGESLPNYDLWKEILDLGIKHKWKVTPIRTVALERYHKMAASIAVSSAKNIDSQEDKGYGSIAGRNKPKSVFPEDSGEISSNESAAITPLPEVRILDTQNELSATTDQDSYVEKRNDSVGRSGDMPIIENNDPPF